MAQLVVAAAGAVAGFFIAGPAGAAAGFALGYSVMAGKGAPAGGGSALQDLRVTGTQYGQSIPWALGAPRMAGQIWWASNKRAISHSQSAGKGGGQTTTSFTYEVDLLIGLTDGPISSVTRVWSNGKLVWTNLAGATDASRIASEGTEVWARLTIYNGSTSQLPDPTYEAAVGLANAPAYRGRSVVFVEGLQLGSSGQIPNLTFEVATALDPSPTITRRTLNTATGVAYDTLSTPGVGVPCMLSISPTVRIGTQGSSVVRVFGLDGVLQSTGTRTSAEVYPGPQGSVFDPATGLDRFNYPVGIIDGKPVRVYNQDLAIGTSGKPCLTVGRTNYNDTGSFVDLALLLPSGEYIGGHAMCSDGVHALLLTASSGAPSVVNKWYLVLYSGGVGSLVRSGTLATAVSIYKFGVGIVGYRSAACMLEDDLLHVWTVNGAGGGDVEMWRLDADNVMRLRGGLYSGNGMTTASYYLPALWAQASFAVVAMGPTFGAFRRSGDSIVTVPLGDAITAICARAGLAGSQFDVSALAASPKVVRALAVAQVGPSRSALEQLQTAYQFEAVLSDKLYFRPRGGASVATIPYADLGASSGGAAQVQPLPLTIAGDLELPPQVAVQYLNTAGDQQSATEVSDRLIAGQAALSTVSLGLALLPSEAKAAADAIVADQLASLVTTSLALTLQYASLEPSDVVQVVDAAGNVHRLRLVKRHDSHGVLKFDAVGDDAQAIVSAGTTSSTYTAAADVVALANTTLYPLDIPLLRDTDDTPGYYVAVRGTSPNFPGAVAYTSVDNVTYTEAAEIAESAVLGTCTTTLGNWSDGWVMDEINSVTVTLADGQLSSVTRDALLAGADVNAMLIGKEIVRFANAVLLSTAPSVYKLTRLLRGQRGTEWATTGHAANELAVLLRPRGMRRVVQKTADLNAARFLKGVTLGKSPSSVSAQNFTCTGVSQRPFAPVVGRAITLSSGYTLTWERRTRLQTAFRDGLGVIVPLGETAEAYEIDVFDAGHTLLKSLKSSSQTISFGLSVAVGQFLGVFTYSWQEGGYLYALAGDVIVKADPATRVIIATSPRARTWATLGFYGVPDNVYISFVVPDGAGTAYLGLVYEGPQSSPYVVQQIVAINLASMVSTGATPLDLVGAGGFWATNGVVAAGKLFLCGSVYAVVSNFQSNVLHIARINAATLAYEAKQTYPDVGYGDVSITDDGSGNLVFVSYSVAAKMSALVRVASATLLETARVVINECSSSNVLRFGSRLVSHGRGRLSIIDLATNTLIQRIVLRFYKIVPGIYNIGGNAIMQFYDDSKVIGGGSVVVVLRECVIIDSNTGNEIGTRDIDNLQFAGVVGAAGVLAADYGLNRTKEFADAGTAVGGTAVVYQISGAVGRGYPATINL